MRRVLAIASVAGMFVVGCGGGDDDETGPIAWLNQARSEGVDIPADEDEATQGVIDDLCSRMNDSDIGVLAALVVFINAFADLYPYYEFGPSTMSDEQFSRLVVLGVDARCSEHTQETERQFALYREAKNEPAAPLTSIPPIETSRAPDGVDFVDQLRAEGIVVDRARAERIMKETCELLEDGLILQEAQVEMFARYYSAGTPDQFNPSEEGRIFQLGLTQYCPEQAALAGG